MNSFGKSTPAHRSLVATLSKPANKRRNVVLALASLLLLGSGIFLSHKRMRKTIPTIPSKSSCRLPPVVQLTITRALLHSVCKKT